MDTETLHHSIYSTVKNIKNKNNLIDYDINDNLYSKKIIKFNKQKCTSNGIYLVIFIIYIMYLFYNFIINN